MYAKFAATLSTLACCLFALGCDTAEPESELDLELRTGQTFTISTTQPGVLTRQPVWGEGPCPPPVAMTSDPTTWPIDLFGSWQQMLPIMDEEWEESSGQYDFAQTCWTLCDEQQLEFNGELELTPAPMPIEMPYYGDKCQENSSEPVQVDLEIGIDLRTTVDCTCAVLQ